MTEGGDREKHPWLGVEESTIIERKEGAIPFNVHIIPDIRKWNLNNVRIIQNRMKFHDIEETWSWRDLSVGLFSTYAT